VDHMGTPQRRRDVVGSEEGSFLDIHNQVQHGLLKKDANAFFNRQVPRNKQVPGLFNYRQLRQAIIPASTWKNAHDRLSPELSEKVARIVRAMEMAIDALGDEDWALEWMLRPHSELNYHIPATLLKTESGARAVEGILGKILYGLPV
jgi:putative toxin-antitoxin system antitoxin component (TIGR02293 family)